MPVAVGAVASDALPHELSEPIRILDDQYAMQRRVRPTGPGP